MELMGWVSIFLFCAYATYQIYFAKRPHQDIHVHLVQNKKRENSSWTINKQVRGKKQPVSHTDDYIQDVPRSVRPE